ncbi:hypothetical protein RDI58_025966 [Solanum bulbocastanum]|uniref:Uncharacterized protein n=1 Tax=Solanum bulbocastanum TaxID=147425 RepID=A0AAN8ST00_SOLBU
MNKSRVYIGEIVGFKSKWRRVELELDSFFHLKILPRDGEKLFFARDFNGNPMKSGRKIEVGGWLAGRSGRSLLFVCNCQRLWALLTLLFSGVVHVLMLILLRRRTIGCRGEEKTKGSAGFLCSCIVLGFFG